MPGNYFQKKGHSVINAEDDADIVIFREALNIAQKKYFYCNS